MIKLDKFTIGYLECALWSSSDESTPEGGYPLDDNYSIKDFDDSTLAKMVEDCRRFQDENAEDLADASETTAGHDFWLTRNGHGAGFWDGDYPEDIGRRLTASSKDFGSEWIIVGDDGKLHV